MSIEIENPKTTLEMIDSAANHVAQIRLAMMIGDSKKAISAVENAERLLFNAICKIQEDEKNANPL